MRFGHDECVEPPIDRRLTFDRVADIYDQVRPSYPGELFDTLFASLPTSPDIIEVGPGTGQATRDLLERGAAVHAIELGPALAERLRTNLASPRLRISVGDFELLDLAPRSADAVFSATAYHWISEAAKTDRPAAVLRPGGIVAIVNLIQVESGDDNGFFAATESIYERYEQLDKMRVPPTRTNVQPPIRSTLEADPRFGSTTLHCYDWNQTYDAASYRKLMQSYSGTQMMPQEARAGLLDEVESLVRERFDNTVVRPVVVALTAAALRP